MKFYNKAYQRNISCRAARKEVQKTKTLSHMQAKIP